MSSRRRGDRVVSEFATAAVSKRATIVSPCNQSSVSARNRVVSGVPWATAFLTACISRTRWFGISTSIESERIRCEADDASARDGPHAMARWSRSFATRRSMVSLTSVMSSLTALPLPFAITRRSRRWLPVISMRVPLSVNGRSLRRPRMDGLRIITVISRSLSRSMESPRATTSSRVTLTWPPAYTRLSPTISTWLATTTVGGGLTPAESFCTSVIVGRPLAVRRVAGRVTGITRKYSANGPRSVDPSGSFASTFPCATTRSSRWKYVRKSDVSASRGSL